MRHREQPLELLDLASIEPQSSAGRARIDDDSVSLVFLEFTSIFISALLLITATLARLIRL